MVFDPSAMVIAALWSFTPLSLDFLCQVLLRIHNNPVEALLAVYYTVHSLLVMRLVF